MRQNRINMVFVLKSFLSVAAALFMGAACSEKGPDRIETPDNTPNKTVINGTQIAEGNNLVGVITDESTGKGIPDVPVTDGYTFTLTDNNGVYQMRANRYCRNVYYTTPSGYEVSLSSNNKLPVFYSQTTIKKTGVNRNDFKLKPLAAAENEFTFIVFSDTQVGNTSHVSRFKNETKTDAIQLINSGVADGSVKNPYSIILGDIIYNKSSMWKPMMEALAGWTVDTPKGYLPIFGCIGNHDYNNAETSGYESVSNYVKNFGPLDYSFDRGNVHFIVMNNVSFTGNASGGDGGAVKYVGGFSDSQIKWLVEDIKLVKDKENKAVVFCAHIPLRGDNIINKEKVLNQLLGFSEAHIMTGHTHYPQNYIHNRFITKNGKPIYEHVHAAACGANWWSNLNTDGTPNGYAVYKIKGNSLVDWAAKSVRFPLEHQMRVYNGNVIPSGANNIKWESKYRDCFIVSLWNDDDENWKVEFVDADGKTTPMTRVTSGQRDWFAYAFMVDVNGRGTTNTWYHRNLRHYWYLKYPGGDPANAKGWKVRATHTLPTSGITHVYEETLLKTDYAGFANY